MKKILVTFTLFCAVVAAQAKDKFVTHVTLTTYNPVASQCDRDPLTTANGTKVNIAHLKSGKQRIAAVSRDLLWCIPMGSIIEIEGHGQFTVHDTMNARFNHYVDIMQHSSKPNFKKEKVKVTVIKKSVSK